MENHVMYTIVYLASKLAEENHILKMKYCLLSKIRKEELLRFYGKINIIRCRTLLLIAKKDFAQ